MTMFPTMSMPRHPPPQRILETTTMPAIAAPETNSSTPTSQWKPCKVAEMLRYTSLMDLRGTLRELENSRNLSVVLVLDERFCGPLASLVARPANRPAMRLVLAVGTGRLPGLETIGDLASGGAALGWHEVVFESDAIEAIGGARATLRAGERLVVIVPSWHATNAIERELR